MTSISGVLPTSVWTVMEPALTWHACFPMVGHGSHLTYYLSLPPEAQVAIEQAMVSEEWPLVEVYTLEALGKTHYFVLGSKGRMSKSKELLYPAELAPGMLDVFRARAEVTAGRTPLGVIWQEKEGWICLILFPLVGAVFVWMGWQIYFEESYLSNDLLRAFGAVMFLAGCAVMSYGLISGVQKRWRIRRALDALHPRLGKAIGPGFIRE